MNYREKAEELESILLNPNDFQMIQGAIGVIERALREVAAETLEWAIPVVEGPTEKTKKFTEVPVMILRAKAKELKEDKPFDKKWTEDDQGRF